MLFRLLIALERDPSSRELTQSLMDHQEYFDGKPAWNTCVTFLKKNKYWFYNRVLDPLHFFRRIRIFSIRSNPPKNILELKMLKQKFIKNALIKGFRNYKENYKLGNRTRNIIFISLRLFYKTWTATWILLNIFFETHHNFSTTQLRRKKSWGLCSRRVQFSSMFFYAI